MYPGCRGSPHKASSNRGWGLAVCGSAVRLTRQGILRPPRLYEYPRYIEISMTQALDPCHGSTSKDSTLADVGKSLNAWVLVVSRARWICSPYSGSTAYPLIGPSQAPSSAFGTARAASDHLGPCISSFCRLNSHPTSLAFQPLHLGLPTARRGLQRYRPPVHGPIKPPAGT